MPAQPRATTVAAMSTPNAHVLTCRCHRGKGRQDLGGWGGQTTQVIANCFAIGAVAFSRWRGAHVRAGLSPTEQSESLGAQRSRDRRDTGMRAMATALARRPLTTATYATAGAHHGDSASISVPPQCARGTNLLWSINAASCAVRPSWSQRWRPVSPNAEKRFRLQQAARRRGLLETTTASPSPAATLATIGDGPVAGARAPKTWLSMVVQPLWLD